MLFTDRIVGTLYQFIHVPLFYHSSILLGTKGFDVPRLSEKLDRLDTAKTFEPLEPVRETDIQVNLYFPLYVKWFESHSYSD